MIEEKKDETSGNEVESEAENLEQILELIGNEPKDGNEIIWEHLKSIVEALVFASEKPLTLSDLVNQTKSERNSIQQILETLKEEYSNRGFRLEEIAGGYSFRTSPVCAPFVRDLLGKPPIKMSRAILETLSIVAYRQPVTRPEIDDIRGVDSGGSLKTLLERDMIRILGKKEEPGRPLLYGTTKTFLEFFNLKALTDLPALKEFSELTEESQLELTELLEKKDGKDPV